MKKLFAIALALLLALTAFSACAETLAGGWSHAEDPTVTEDRQILFEEGVKNLVGVNYVPVAYLGSQVVAGINHCFLCQATAVTPDAQPAWVLVYLYESFDGSVSVLSITPFDFGELCVY